MLKYVKAFARDELDLALVNFNTLVIKSNYVVCKLLVKAGFNACI